VTGSRKSKGSLSHRLSTQDAAFIYGESYHGPLHVGCITYFDGHIDHDEFVAHMEARMHLLPRYRQRLVFVPLNLAHATWEDDPEFEVRKHVYPHSLPLETGKAEFLKDAMEVFASMLDRGRPLWEAHVFSGIEGDQTAIIWKMHHCLVDGVSGMELLSASLDLRRDTPVLESPEPFRAQPLPGPAKSLMLGIFDAIQNRIDEARQAVHLMEQPYAAAKRLARIAYIGGRIAQMSWRPIVAAPWNARLITAERSLAYLELSFNHLRAIRNALGGTINDTVLAILSEAAARYLAYHRVNTRDAPLRIGCPVSVRHQEERGTLGNRVSMMFVECPSTPMAAVTRLAAIIQTTTNLKTTGEAGALESLVEASDWLPPTLLGLGSVLITGALDAAVRLGEVIPAISRMFTLPPPGINFIATNVPGAQIPMYLEGRPMTSMIGCVPLAANIGYSVAIVTYNHHVVFGLMAEPSLMPDVERMRDYAAEVFDELIAAAKTKAGVEAQSDQG
jgi:diacylglycerol O-acyltransferase / wax synthase